jgi:hypothetical protein
MAPTINLCVDRGRPCQKVDRGLVSSSTSLTAKALLNVWPSTELALIALLRKSTHEAMIPFMSGILGKAR